MSSMQCDKIAFAYETRFGNFQEVSPPEVLADDGFWKLLERALGTGKPVTIEDVRAVCGEHVDWDRVVD